MCLNINTKHYFVLMLERPLSTLLNFPFKNKSIKEYSVGQICAKIWNVLFLRFLHLALKVAKNYTYTGEVLYVCWRSTYTGEVLYVYGRPILRNFTYTGEVFYVYGRFTYTGEVFYVYWRFTYTGDFTYTGATLPPNVCKKFNVARFLLAPSSSSIFQHCPRTLRIPRDIKSHGKNIDFQHLTQFYCDSDFLSQ